MTTRNPKIITAKQARAQINHLGRSLIAYILFFIFLQHGLNILFSHYPAIFDRFDIEIVALVASNVWLLFVAFVIFQIAAAFLNLSIKDYLHSSKMKFSNLIAYTATAIAIQLFITSISSLFYFFYHSNVQTYAFFGIFTTQTYVIKNVLYLILFIFIRPLCDEFIFRGFIQRKLGHYGRYFGVIASAFLYALAQPTLFQAVQSFILGWYLSSITLRYHSIRPSIFIHMVLSLFTVLMNLFFQTHSLIFILIIILSFIVSGLSIFQKKITPNFVRYGATEPTLWKILLTSSSIIFILFLFIINVTLSFLV